MHHVYHRKLKGDTESIMKKKEKKKERPSRMTKSKPEEKKKSKICRNEKM